MVEIEYGRYCRLLCSHFRHGECFVDMDSAFMTGPPLCEVLDDEMLEDMVKENYTIRTGDVRREWENPDADMLAWLSVHQVGASMREADGNDQVLYSYMLDDGRKVWETYNTRTFQTTLVAIEEV